MVSFYAARKTLDFTHFPQNLFGGTPIASDTMKIALRQWQTADPS
ncbi:hypothetical protein AB3480_34535 [Rhizobium mongolense]